MEAAKKGDTTSVRAALEKLPQDSKTVVFDAVHETCRGNHDECLALLLPHVETTQVGFGILLSECVHANHVACTEVLLQHWKSVCKNEEFVPHVSKHSAGQSAGVCPAMWSDPAVCRVLIDAGADIETKDGDGLSPLHEACESGELDAVKMLVEAGAGVRVTDMCHRTCLALAAERGHTETVRYLVGLPDVDVNELHYCVRAALRSGLGQYCKDVVQVLIDAGADVNIRSDLGRTSPLHEACESGVLNVAKILVRAGARVCVTDEGGSTCLTRAADGGHTETVRYLVGLPDVDVNHQDVENNSALHCAVISRQTDIVQVLIAAGADVDALGALTCGYSPLHYACYSGALGVVAAQLLIDAGADIETKSNQGYSPLHLACNLGALDMVKMLVEAGAGVRATDNQGDTCLTLAAYFGHTDTVRYLVGLPEVDVNLRGCDNKTALQCAVDEEQRGVEQVLIAAGADMDTENTDGRSP